MSEMNDADPQSKPTSDAGEAQPRGGASPAESGGADFEGRVIPAPESFPKAPPIDLATVRVNWVELPKQKSGYFLARSYIEGVEVAQINASSKESALAGAVASIETAWRNKDAKPKKVTRT